MTSLSIGVGKMRLCRSVAAALPLLLLLTACGPYVSTASALENPATPESTDPSAPPVVAELTCEGDQRSHGIYDYFTDASAGNDASTPEDAARLWEPSDDDVVVAEKAAGQALVWLIRADGTAHTRLGVRRFDDGTWGVETSESCVGGGAPSHRRD